MADPDVATVAMAIGGSGRAGNNGNLFITLKPRNERNATAQQIIARLRPKLEKVEGARLYHAGGAGRAARRPADANPVRVHAAGRQSGRTERMGAEDPGEDADAAGAARRRHRPADQRHHAGAEDQPRHRLALRHPAATDRRHAVRRVRPAPGDAVFHAAQQLSRDPRSAAGTAGQPRHAEQDLCEVADHRRPGAAVDLCDLDQRAGAAAVDQPSGPVPGDHHQLQPRAGRGAGPGDRRGAEGDGRTRRADHAQSPASRAPRRRSSNRSAPCRC